VSREVYVLLIPGVHALDFAGPVQAIYEASAMGADYRLRYVGSEGEIRSAQGFVIGKVEPLPWIGPADWLLVPGTESSRLDALRVPRAWLRDALERGARISSICSGAFVLAKAGLLDGRECTTHWKLIELLQAWSPTARVLENRLFVCDENVFTSAGEASGIDLALSVIEDDHGPELAAKVAREMVVYVRRSGSSAQRSIYLEHRAHTHPGVHRVQDWIVAHPDGRATVEQMADVAGVSPRHLTRLFKEATGITLKAFAHKVKLEVADKLANNPELTADDIAERCGFKDARQLRRLWVQHFGQSMGVTQRARRGLVASTRQA
jgi:transcriptional regulator GlxA family with amidase domain